MAKNYRLLVLLVSLCAMVVFGGMTACSKFIKTQQKFEEITFELGDVHLSTDVHDYVYAREELIETARLYTGRVDEDRVGSYTVFLSIDGQKFQYKVRIVDSISPEIRLKSSEEYVCSTSNAITAGDLATVSDVAGIKRFGITSCARDGEPIEMVYNRMIVEEPGEYEVTITAVDNYDNETVETLTVEVYEAPHFLMLANRRYDIGTTYGLMDLVFAEDRYGNDITDRIEVIDDGGYDADTMGSYDVTYKVTDADNFSCTETINIQVGIASTPSVGFEDTDYLPFFMERNHFYYEPFENNEDLDAAVELTSRSSFAVKSNIGWCSCCLLEITDEYMYFLTNTHCDPIFTYLDDIYLVDAADNRITIHNDEIDIYKHPIADVLIFRVPLYRIPAYYLLNYRCVAYDPDIVDELGYGTPIFLDAQQWGYVNREDIVEATSIARMSIYIPELSIYCTSTTSMIGTPGTSGCPIFTYDGYLVGIDEGVYMGHGFQEAVIVRLVDIRDLINTVEFV